MARRFRLSPQLVSKLFVEARKQPEKLREKKAAEKRRLQALQATESVASGMLVRDRAIRTSQQVQHEVKAQHQVELSQAVIRSVLRKQLGLGYRMAQRVPIHANTERCLVLRQQYALAMLPLLRSGRRIINVDETWLNESNFTRKVWCYPDAPGTQPLRAMSASLSMIAALDTDGRVFFSLGHATTDQDTFMLFLRHLVV